MLRVRLCTLLLIISVVTQSGLVPLAQAGPAASSVQAAPLAAKNPAPRRAAAAPTVGAVPGSAVPLGDWPLGKELLGGCNGSEAPTTNSCGQPVNTATGNFWHSFTDLAVPGRGAALLFTRTYNSLEAGTNNPLGWGWTYDYNMHIDNTTDPTVYQENGSTAPFSNGGPIYQPGGNRVMAQLSRDATTGRFTFTRTHDLTRFIFKAMTDPVAPGKLAQIIDRHGYSTYLAYDSATGLLQSVQDPADRFLNFHYSFYLSGRQLDSVTDTTGQRVVSFLYYNNGDLWKSIDVGGKQTIYSYDANHHLLTMTDPNNGTLTNTYDSSGRVLTQRDALNRTLTFQYVTGNQARVTDTLGIVTLYNYDRNRLTSVVANAGAPPAQQATWTYVWNGDGGNVYPSGLYQLTDPNNHTWTNYWDLQGNVLSTTNPLNYTTYFAYNPTNDLTTITNTRGITTAFTYDYYGNLKTITRPLTQTGQLATTQFFYDPTNPGDLTGITNPRGKSWSFDYDGYGYVLRAADPLSHVTGLTHDSIGQLLQINNPKHYSATLAYDAYGAPTIITDTLGNQTKYKYDPNHNLQTITDTRGLTTTYTYDADNELTRLSRPDSTHSDYAYDGDGNVVTQTNALGQTTRNGYDRFNRLISVTTPYTRTAAYSYDPAGNLKVITDAQGLTATLGYDTANQLLSINYQNSAQTPNVTFTYNPLGLRATMVDGIGTTLYTYDSLDRLMAVRDGLGATVSYGYDLADNITTLTYPDLGTGTRTTTRQYDDANRMTGLTDWLNNTFSFTYDANSNLTDLTYPNKVHGGITYDGADQVSSIRYDLNNQAPFLGFSYTRDPAGLLATAGEIGVVPHNYDYHYDALDRLRADQSAISMYDRRTWDYDAATQISQTSVTNAATGDLTTTTRNYNTANELYHLTEKLNGTFTKDRSYTYSTTGNRTGQSDAISGSNLTYTYDQANRLLRIDNGAPCCPVGIYTYDGHGLRMSKTRVGGAELFTWDSATGVPMLLQERTPSGASGISASYIYGPGGLLLEQIQHADNHLTFYHLDQLGSVRALTDKTGAVVATYNYDAYGVPIGSTGSAAQSFGYAGEYTDPESGFLYLRARYYDPATQQFLTVDPLLALTEQAYNYATGSPLNATDPSGLWVESALDLAFIALDLGDVACNGLGGGNGLALAADLLGLALPGVTGLGLGTRLLSHLGEGGRLALRGGETLYRGGSTTETLTRLSQNAQKALDKIGIHGVSVTINKGKLATYGDNISSALRSAVEEHFSVHNTGPPDHRTIELPKPLTQEHVDLFNKIFGR